MKIYTDAPAEYDGFGTHAIQEVGIHGSRSVRLVEVREDARQWQCARYQSGLYFAASEEEFPGLAGLVTMHPQPITRRQQIRQECERLAEEAAKRIGASAWYEHAERVLTAVETNQVRDLWDALPGNASWTDAFLTWMRQEESPCK